MGYCSSYFSGGRGMMRGGMFGFGILWWILIAVVIIAVIYFLKNRPNQQTETSNSVQQNPSHQTTYHSAFDLLDEEFARGNITEEEYLHKKDVLKK